MKSPMINTFFHIRKKFYHLVFINQNKQIMAHFSERKKQDHAILNKICIKIKKTNKKKQKF